MNSQLFAYRVLACAAVLLVVGCSSPEVTPEVQCDSGSTQEVSCGLYNNGTQKQRCVEYQWVDDGACVEASECLGNDTRTRANACGLNERGTLREQCHRGLWTSVAEIAGHACANAEDPNECACVDADQCIDQQETVMACGFEDSGEKLLRCVEGQWQPDSACEGGYECTAGDTKIEVHSCGFNGRGAQSFECTEGRSWATTTCEDPDQCQDGKYREVECPDETGGNGLPKIKHSECVNGTWSNWSACEDSLECQPGAQEITTCGVNGNYSGQSHRVCESDKEWSTDDCWQQAHFIYSAPYSVLIRTEDKALLSVGDNQHRTAGTDSLSDDYYVFPTITDAVDAEGRRERFSASTSHQCGVGSTGYLFCWGDNAYGQLGQPASQTPVADRSSVTSMGDSVKAVSVGEGFTCALSEGDVYCWGKSDRQQLGRDSVVPFSITPQKVLEGARAIAAGAAHVCALKGHQVFCWGANDEHQASASEDAVIPTPQLHSTLSYDPGRDQSPPDDGRLCPPALLNSEILALTAGRAHTLVSWKSTWREQSFYGSLTCHWHKYYRNNLNVIGVGRNVEGQLGAAAETSAATPVELWHEQLPSDDSARFMPRAMGDVSCVVRTQGGVETVRRCTGDNSEEQLHENEGHVRGLVELPADLGDGEVIAQLAIGFDSVCVLLEDTHRIRCRGGNDHGQLGDGTTDSRDESDFMLHQVNGD